MYWLTTVVTVAMKKPSWEKWHGFFGIEGIILVTRNRKLDECNGEVRILIMIEIANDSCGG